ncbi:MAG: phosphoglycerate kinase [Proteobacteria bacterium]|nr:phosphoglycerate kinase [Pseudomonadota bacterium]
MKSFKTIDEIEVAGKRVFLRGDLNVPMRAGVVTDRTRIEKLVPTIDELADKGARVIVASHFGRPKGKPVPEMSLKPVAQVLSEVMGGKRVRFLADCVGAAVEEAVAKMGDGDVALLENLRFHPGEEKNDPAFAEALAQLADVYVNDAFSAAHRAHASTEGIAHLLPAAAGRLMQAELDALSRALDNPGRPLAALVGGAKISTKLAVLGNLVEKVDMLVIGGAMANTFLFALGKKVGKSLYEPDMAQTARDIAAKAARVGCKVHLPEEVVVARELAPCVAYQTVSIDTVSDDMMILDMGPTSIADLKARLEDCKTLIWNGPLGAFEVPPFDAGTTAAARAAAALTREGRLLTVAGGGDTVAALKHANVMGAFSYVSTAGGAFLEWLEGRELPGVAALYGAAGRG